MNLYLKNLNKIEFAVTNACTGSCKHCSAGGGSKNTECIDVAVCVDAVKKISKEYSIRTVMAFGGEGLLYPSVVCEIMKCAKEEGIPHRQLITNGYFSRDVEVIKDVARCVAECGVNDLLLSVDACHQESIPLDVVRCFAAELKKHGVPVRLSPAYLVSRTHENPYNKKTHEILESFSDLDIPVGDGNIVFCEGNAKKYLTEYFADTTPKNPYVEDRYDVKCISFSQNGDVLDANVYEKDIMDIIRDYKP